MVIKFNKHQIVKTLENENKFLSKCMVTVLRFPLFLQRETTFVTVPVCIPVQGFYSKVHVAVALLFYVHGKHHAKVMSGRSVNLTTLFLGRLRPPKRLTSTSCTYFRQ